MKRPHYLFRVAALVSSVVLLGGFVSYRAGAFDWFVRSSAEPNDADNTLPPEAQVDDGPRSGKLPWKYDSSPTKIQLPNPAPPTIMNGTKAPLVQN